jgi:protein involved in polysaccharide export with SLBB domain
LRIYWLILALLAVTFTCVDGAYSQSNSTLGAPSGDRITLQNDQRAGLGSTQAVSGPVGDDYVLGPGDVLNIVVKGRVDLGYHVNQAKLEGSTSANPDQITVNPGGWIVIPIAGPIRVAGKTVSELTEAVKSALSDYFKNFNVVVTLASPRMMKVFVNGYVLNPGAHTVSGTSTLLEALLAAGIDVNGSTRRVELRRNGTVRTVDIYSVVIKGQLDANPTLESGDTIFVPQVTRWVEVDGEVTRSGRYELIPGMRIKDLLDLSMGVTPLGMASKAIIDRTESEGSVVAVRVDAEKACASSGSSDNIELKNGDVLRIPNLSEYMPVIRMVGEFVGRGVYQRALGSETEQVLNKNGVFMLAKGKTAGEVIRETGGVTPQADLRNARIERASNGKKEVVAFNLEKLLRENDVSADVTLQNGDTIILPALSDSIYVFGAVGRPGSIAYTPGKKVSDYIGDAGGQTKAGRLSHVRIIRGDPKNPVIMNCDVTKGIRDGGKNNPFLEPGDTVFIAEREFSGWRDVISVFTTIRLLQSLVE